MQELALWGNSAYSKEVGRLEECVGDVFALKGDTSLVVGAKHRSAMTSRFLALVLVVRAIDRNAERRDQQRTAQTTKWRILAIVTMMPQEISLPYLFCITYANEVYVNDPLECVRERSNVNEKIQAQTQRYLLLLSKEETPFECTALASFHGIGGCTLAFSFTRRAVRQTKQDATATPF